MSASPSFQKIQFFTDMFRPRHLIASHLLKWNTESLMLCRPELILI